MSRDHRSGGTRGYDARDIAPPLKRDVVELRRFVVKDGGGGVCHVCEKPKRRTVCATRKADVVMRGRSCISSLSFSQSLIHSILLPLSLLPLLLSINRSFTHKNRKQ